MKKLTAKGTRRLKIIHLIFASMWLGGALSLLVMMLSGGYEFGGEAMRSHALQMQAVDDFVVIPGALGCLLTGLVYCIWTNWGFFKHRWVGTKLVLTVLMVLFGTFAMGPKVNGNVYSAEELARYTLENKQYFSNIYYNTIFAAVQLGAMLYIFIISVTKPWRRSRA